MRAYIKNMELLADTTRYDKVVHVGLTLETQSTLDEALIANPERLEKTLSRNFSEEDNARFCLLHALNTLMLDPQDDELVDAIRYAIQTNIPNNYQAPVGGPTRQAVLNCLRSI